MLMRQSLGPIPPQGCTGSFCAQQKQTLRTSGWTLKSIGHDKQRGVRVPIECLAWPGVVVAVRERPANTGRSTDIKFGRSPSASSTWRYQGSGSAPSTSRTNSRHQDDYRCLAPSAPPVRRKSAPTRPLHYLPLVGGSFDQTGWPTCTSATSCRSPRKKYPAANTPTKSASAVQPAITCALICTARAKRCKSGTQCVRKGAQVCRKRRGRKRDRRSGGFQLIAYSFDALGSVRHRIDERRKRVMRADARIPLRPPTSGQPRHSPGGSRNPWQYYLPLVGGSFDQTGMKQIVPPPGWSWHSCCPTETPATSCWSPWK